jgi:hypothetical protein
MLGWVLILLSLRLRPFFYSEFHVLKIPCCTGQTTHFPVFYENVVCQEEQHFQQEDHCG